MTNPATPPPPCPFCGAPTAHDLTLRLQRHIAALQQQVEGLAAEKALLRAELARCAYPATEEAYAGREQTDIGLSYAATAAALKRIKAEATTLYVPVPEIDNLCH